MKKPYQIESQRAVKQLETRAADGNPAVRMVPPLAEMLGWLRKGVGELVRQAGLQLMEMLMERKFGKSLGNVAGVSPISDDDLISRACAAKHGGKLSRRLPTCRPTSAVTERGRPGAVHEAGFLDRPRRRADGRPLPPQWADAGKLGRQD
jgi:hypothetical protein